MFDTAQSNGLWFLDNHVQIPIPAGSNAGGVAVLILQMPFNEAPPLHVHHEEDEIFHVLRGEIRFRVGERTVVARKGDTVLAPRGIPHGFRVQSVDGVEALVIARKNFETMVRNVARPAPAATLPEAVEITPAMQADLAKACAAEGIDLLGPPIA